MKAVIKFLGNNPTWVKIVLTLFVTLIVVLLLIFKPTQPSGTDVKKESHGEPERNQDTNLSNTVSSDSTSKDSFGARDQKANKVVSKTSRGSDETDELVVGNIQAQSNSATYISISNNGQINTVPVTLIIDVPRDKPRHYDYSLIFDITNTSDLDLRVVSIFLRTKDWHPLEQIVKYIPLAGLGEERKYFCIIDKDNRRYKANFEIEGKYLKLKPKELETVDMKVTALTEGVYEFEVIIEYSVAGKTKELKFGPLGERFLDRSRIDVLPR